MTASDEAIHVLLLAAFLQRPAPIGQQCGKI